MRKNILWLMIFPVFFFPQIALACGNCNGNGPHNGTGNYSNMGYSYNSSDAKLMQEFHAKRVELNRLYSQGAKDDDKRVQTLVKELDAMSEKMGGHMNMKHASNGPCPAAQNGQRRYQSGCGY